MSRGWEGGGKGVNSGEQGRSGSEQGFAGISTGEGRGIAGGKAEGEQENLGISRR